MKKFIKYNSLYLSALSLLIFIASCDKSINNDFDNPETKNAGKIFLDISMSNDLVSAMDTMLVSYHIVGNSSGGENFDISTILKTIEISELSYDNWTVLVYAKGAEDKIVGSGSGTTTVSTGKPAAINISILPLDGSGILDITINWNSNEVFNPLIISQLISNTGEPLNLILQNTNEDTRSIITKTGAGSYCLLVKLFEDGELLHGLVDEVNIQEGKTTSKNFDFKKKNRNPADNTIQVNIVPELSTVIDVSMSGQDRQMDINETMVIETIVPADVGNVVGVWYVNGVSVDVGSSYSIYDFSKGIYRIDVTVFSTDGKKAGSASHRLSVLEYDTSENYPPILDPINNKTINEGELLQFSVDAIDQNNDDLTFSASDLPAGADFNADIKTFTWLPDYTQAGSYTIHFEVSDAEFTDYEDISLVVSNTLPGGNDVSIFYTGDLIVKHPNTINLAAIVTQESAISIGDLSLIKVDFEVSEMNNDGTTNLIDHFISQCNAYGLASTFAAFDIGVYSIAARIIYEGDYLTVEDIAVVPVYFPDRSSVSGDGEIEVTNPDEGNLGKTDFKFSARYKKDKIKGDLKLKYKDGNIDLKSKQIDWLVISGVSAQFEGTGKNKGQKEIYTFRINCTEIKGKKNDDKITIKIWEGTDTQGIPIYEALNQNLNKGSIKIKNK